MSTLKDQYETKKLCEKVKWAETKLASTRDVLTEKSKLIEAKLLTEERVLKLLAETLDKKDIEQIQHTLDGFDQIVPDGSALGAALQGIRNELLKSMQGGLLNKIKDMLTPKNAKPIARAMAFLASLKQGLVQLNTILKTALPRGTDLSKTGDQSLNQILNDQEKAVMVQNAFLKAIKPTGIFQVFSAIPYLDAKNAQNVAVDLMNMTGPEITKLMQGAATTQVSANKADIQAAVQTAAGKENVATQSSEETKPSGAAEPSKPSKGTVPGAETKPSNAHADAVKKAALARAATDSSLADLPRTSLNKMVDIVLDALKQPGAGFKHLLQRQLF